MEHDETDILNQVTQVPKNQKWTLFLILCCFTVSLSGSFNFGFNIASMNSPTNILKEFIKRDFFLFREYYEKKAMFEEGESWIKGNETRLKEAKQKVIDKQTKMAECLDFFNYNTTCVKILTDESKASLEENNKKLNASFTSMDELLNNLTKRLEDKKAFLELNRVKLEAGRQKVDNLNDIIWTVTNGLFVVGGMIGAFTSKYVLDFMGRKNGALFNSLFNIFAGVLVFISPYLKSPVCIIVSRFLFGIQGGMACSIVPTYLSEISPVSLRGQTGVMPQLFVTIGILFGQILGFKEIFGNEELWNYLLAFPIVPALTGGILFLIFCPESPKALILKNKSNEAKKALKKIRNESNVDNEILQMRKELNSSSDENTSIIGLFKLRELRWPIITSLIIQVCQQLSGVNAIFFYSSSIFSSAGIPSNMIQYAILSTGLVNVITTIICVPLIDRLGRKPLLVYPMAFMILDFILLTVFLNLKGNIFSYLSIVCIVVFIICFAVGLGPIPFIYSAECFRQSERSSAMAVCIFINWLASLLLTLTFPFLQNALKEYVFLVFLVIVGLCLVLIIFKVPETKGKTADEIIAKFSK